MTNGAVLTLRCIDSDSKMSLEEQYTTGDPIQWQDVLTQKSLSTACKKCNPCHVTLCYYKKLCMYILYLSTSVFIACTIIVKVHSYCHGESFKQPAKESACSYPIRHQSVSSTGGENDIVEAHC